MADLCVAAQVAVVIAHDLQQGEFVAQVPFFKPLQQAKDFTPTPVFRLPSAVHESEI